MNGNATSGKARISELVTHTWSIIEWLQPHLVWIMGLIFVLDPFLDYYRTDTYVYWLSTEPEITMWLIGFITLLCGRIAVGYRKKWRQEKRRADRNQERVDELNDYLIDEIQMSGND